MKKCILKLSHKKRCKQWLVLIKASLVSACLFYTNVGYAAISPWAQQDLDIGEAVEFIESHPLVLHGLKRIESPNYGKVIVVYDYINELGDKKTCYATFTQSFLAMLLPKGNVSYSGSTCPVYYDED